MNEKINSGEPIEVFKHLNVFKNYIPYYPKVKIETSSHPEDRVVKILDTLIRIEREGIWYVVRFTKKSINIDNNFDSFFENVMHEIYLIQNFYKISGEPFDYIDDCQDSEELRLINILENNK